MEPTRITYLLKKHLEDTLDDQERQELANLTTTREAAAYLEEAIVAQLQQLPDVPGALPKETALAAVKNILAVDKGGASLHRIYFLRKWRWAAAAILVLGVATYVLTNNKKQPALPALTVNTTDIQPGKPGAILTLANGTQVLLDTIQNGVVAMQGAATAKIINGKLLYEASSADNKPVYNTMTTPRGRQFQVILPDGTKAWLNAASSITYPTTFTGKERRIKITGEVYLDVARNAQMPFHVNAGNKAEIDVLGTQFNVNAYENENCVNTTLLEGSVRIQNMILKTGQQAQIVNNDIKVLSNTDIEKVVAWKNGFFNFDGDSLEEAMRQLERWYDVEVVYEKNIPHMKLTGRMTKGVTLNGLLIGLKALGVNCRLEGRRLIVIS